MTRSPLLKSHLNKMSPVKQDCKYQTAFLYLEYPENRPNLQTSQTTSLGAPWIALCYELELPVCRWEEPYKGLSACFTEPGISCDAPVEVFELATIINIFVNWGHVHCKACLQSRNTVLSDQVTRKLSSCHSYQKICESGSPTASSPYHYIFPTPHPFLFPLQPDLASIVHRMENTSHSKRTAFRSGFAQQQIKEAAPFLSKTSLLFIQAERFPAFNWEEPTITTLPSTASLWERASPLPSCAMVNSLFTNAPGAWLCSPQKKEPLRNR